jgi:hypothetical protein
MKVGTFRVVAGESVDCQAETAPADAIARRFRAWRSLPPEAGGFPEVPS